MKTASSFAWAMSPMAMLMVLVPTALAQRSLAQTSNVVKWGGPVARYAFAYPDINAAYWLLHFKVPTSGKLSFRIKGQFPYARYFSLSVYDLDTTDVFDGLLDSVIKPDAGSQNPFVPGTARNVGSRNYTVWVLPAGSKNSSRPNTITIGSKIKHGTLMMRVYLPDRGRNIAGGVALPTIEAFDDVTGKVMAKSQFLMPVAEGARRANLGFGSALARFRSHIRATVDKRISFYRLWFGAGYPNLDVGYLIAGLSTNAADQVAVIRFRAPTFEDTYAGGGKLAGDREVRYWSMNVGIDQWTQILDAKRDDQLRPDKDGLITMVVGPTSVRVPAERAGFGWLPNGTQLGPLCLWFRHLAASKKFPVQIRSLPLFDPKKPLNGQRAEMALGEYAPTGRYYTVNGFLAALRSGGFRSSFSTYGQGCPGLGKAVPRIASRGGLPSLGNRLFQLRVSGAASQAGGFVVHGGDRTNWNGVRLPYSLLPIGGRGCQLLTSVDIVVPFRTNTVGSALISAPIPAMNFMNRVIFSQAFVKDPAAPNRLRMASTAGARSFVGR